MADPPPHVDSQCEIQTVERNREPLVSDLCDYTYKNIHVGVRSNFYDVCSDWLNLMKAPLGALVQEGAVISLYISLIFIWPITSTDCLTGLSLELSG